MISSISVLRRRPTAAAAALPAAFTAFPARLPRVDPLVLVNPCSASAASAAVAATATSSAISGLCSSLIKASLASKPLLPLDPPPPIEPQKNKVVVTAQGQVLWNGNPVTLDQLRQYIDITQQMNPVPELHLQPDATARYELVDEVLAVTKRAHVQKMGFVGNEYYMSIF